MMMLKSVCLVYIIVFASLCGANVTEEKIDGYDVVDNKTGNTDDVVIKKDGTTLTVQITNSDKNYTIFKSEDNCIVKYGNDEITCPQVTDELDPVPADIRTACGNTEVLYMTGECENENRRRKRAIRRCYYIYFYVWTYCPRLNRCDRCIRRFRSVRCYYFGK